MWIDDLSVKWSLHPTPVFTNPYFSSTVCQYITSFCIVIAIVDLEKVPSKLWIIMMSSVKFHKSLQIILRINRSNVWEYYFINHWPLSTDLSLLILILTQRVTTVLPVLAPLLKLSICLCDKFLALLIYWILSSMFLSFSVFLICCIFSSFSSVNSDTSLKWVLGITVYISLLSFEASLFTVVLFYFSGYSIFSYSFIHLCYHLGHSFSLRSASSPPTFLKISTCLIVITWVSALLFFHCSKIPLFHLL